MWQAIRTIQVLKPGIFFMENVITIDHALNHVSFLASAPAALSSVPSRTLALAFCRALLV